MSGYFYLLCLLITIDCTFCYDYIPANNSPNQHGKRLRKMVRSQSSKPVGKYYVHKKRQEYEMVEDKDPTALIDVVSFIQKPDEYAIDDNLHYEMDDKRKINFKQEKDYRSFLEYNPDEYSIQKRNREPYNLDHSLDNSLNFGPNPPNLNVADLAPKDALNPQHLNLDFLSLHGLNNGKVARNSENKLFYGSYMPEPNDVYSKRKEKKCILRQMKFPFFSHNKTGTQKLKKDKKRKAFCFNCSNKEKKPDNVPASDVSNEAPSKESQDSLTKILLNVPGGLDLSTPKSEIIRGKRDDVWTGQNDRERQIKELDEIQKKVDNLEILPLPFQRHSDGNT